MKNLVTPLFLFLFSNFCFSQVIVDDVNINEKEDVKICRMVAIGNMLSNKVSITIDYGQSVKWSKGKNSSVIKDAKGKVKSFNSVIAAINFMENNGWDYYDAYVLTEETGFGRPVNIINYTFKKRN